MLFNDYVKNLELQYEELGKLKLIISELNFILDLVDTWDKTAFRYGYVGLIDSSYTSSYSENAKKLSEDASNYFTRLREELISIDFLEFGEILANIKTIGSDVFSGETDNLILSLKKSYKVIHVYRSYKGVDQRVDEYIGCIHAIRNMIETFSKFRYMFNYIKSINNKLCAGFEGDGLEIQLLNHGVSKDTYPNVVDSIYTIYDKLCEIANVKEELIIARVETGSLFAKFIGSTAILKVVAKIIETTYDIGIRNLSREGKKKNLVESTELFKEQFNILKEMENMGLDVEEHKEIASETLVLIMKQSNILLSSSPDIRINEKTLSKSDDIKALLSKQDYKLLETLEDDEN
ncbi:hypothetical protein [Paraclostridium sordellii]|uniref:hypothetical protein n=1 Tax=Paraclostridium sordellii TaxID=1505 RepID=UPI0005DF2091|nr:hypothetical protein [Paeniclostridium sordellii]MDU1456264.1 hypothetical protein [Paeniclostridium sordellii]CEP83963.1 Uncharacterised protein [[Clostridium] sordellii] [Paeniclostridium sordellii]